MKTNLITHYTIYPLCGVWTTTVVIFGIFYISNHEYILNILYVSIELLK